MTMKGCQAVLGLIVLAGGSLAGCGMDEPPPAVVNGNVPVSQNVSPQVPSAPTPAALNTGMQLVEPLVKDKLEPYHPIVVQPDHRLLLHPGEGAPARFVVDVRNIRSLTLSPVIESFQGNDTCMADPEAGVVGLHWRLDGGPVQSVVVDRHFSETIPVDTSAGQTMTIESSDQNGVIWCDWLAIGFTDVTAG